MKKTLAVVLSATMLAAAMSAPAIALSERASKASLWTEVATLFADHSSTSPVASDARVCPGFVDADGDGLCDFGDAHHGARHHGHHSDCGWRS